MSDVLAINVDQPYASLLAHGVTNWLTTAEPPPDGVTDAEWLIVSDDERPSITFLPGFTDITGEPRAEGHECAWLDCRTYPNTVIPLPLGAVLGVGRVLDVLPIVPHAGCRDGSPHVCIGSYGMLAHSKLHEPWPDGETEHDISDQLPYGDWSPGRWAWRMEVRRLDPPVREYDCPFGCVASGTIHECSPESRALCVEPVRGRQGVWRPDPALVAAVREVPDAR